MPPTNRGRASRSLRKSRAASFNQSDDSRYADRLPAALGTLSFRSLRFHGQQRDALHAELLARALGVIRNELILRIIFLLDQIQSGRLDHLPIIVLLRGAPDAGSPEGRIADDAFGQLHLRHDVGDREPAARFQQSPDFAKHLRFVSGKIDDAIADHQIGQAIGQRSLLDIALDVSHVEEAVAVAQPLRLGSLLVLYVDTDNFAAGPHAQRGDERVHPRAAAEVDDGFARFWIGQVKIVADARERFDCFRWYAVEISWRVAEAFGHRAAHLEMEFSIRILGDAPIHRLYLGFEFLGVEHSDRGHGRNSSSKLLVLSASGVCQTPMKSGMANVKN